MYDIIEKAKAELVAYANSTTPEVDMTPVEVVLPEIMADVPELTHSYARKTGGILKACVTKTVRFSPEDTAMLMALSEMKIREAFPYLYSRRDIWTRMTTDGRETTHTNRIVSG